MKNDDNKDVDFVDVMFTMINSLSSNATDVDIIKGMLMIRGVVLDKNVDEGLKLIQDAAKNSELARYRLAELYTTGQFIPKNIKKAKKVLNSDNGTIVSVENSWASLKIAQMALAYPDDYIKNSRENFKNYVLNNLQSASDNYIPEAEYQYSLFDDVVIRFDAEALLNHAASLGYEPAVKRQALLAQNAQKIKKLKTNSDEQRAEAIKLGNIASCGEMSDVTACATELKNAGMYVGDYLLLDNKSRNFDDDDEEPDDEE